MTGNHTCICHRKKCCVREFKITRKKEGGVGRKRKGRSKGEMVMEVGRVGKRRKWEMVVDVKERRRERRE